jgi:hypothetical protein
LGYAFDLIYETNLKILSIMTDLLKILLGNGSVNTPATYVHATIGRPSLGNGELNTPGNLGNGVFDAVRVIDTRCNNRRTGKSFLHGP